MALASLRSNYVQHLSHRGWVVTGKDGKTSPSQTVSSELVTIVIVFALKGGHFRAFYRWLKPDYDDLFVRLLGPTRLQRNLAANKAKLDLFLVQASLFSVMDSYPVELLFPIRAGRSQRQLGKKSLDKGRWMIDGWSG